MNVDMVLQGGGILGISYIGVLKALEEKGYKIKRCAGTSAGSIIACLVTAGYTWKELYEIARNTDFRIFMKKTKLSKFFYAGKLLSVILNKGIYDSSILEKWIQELLEKKGVTKFSDITNKSDINNKNVSKLKVISADITRREIITIPEDLTQYSINIDEFSIAKAIRMSCAIPFFFTPVLLEYGGDVSYLVDGGLLSNYPIWVFDIEGIPRWPTFGVKFKKKGSFTSQKKTGILYYFLDVIRVVMNYDAAEYLRNKDKVRTIEIEIDKDIVATDFIKTKENIDYLFNKGYEAAISFIDQWDFNEYIKKYRTKAN